MKPGTGLTRRTRLTAGGNLKRSPIQRTGWPRFAPLLPEGGFARWVPPQPAGTDPARKSAATTGSRTTSRRTANSGPTPQVREAVLKRDGYRCACGCRRTVVGQRYSLGHRLRASQGGKPVASNLLTFLGWGGEACHGRIDGRRDPRDEANGMTVRSWQDPKQVPVTVTAEDGSKVRKFLWDDGTVRDAPEPAEVAA